MSTKSGKTRPDEGANKLISVPAQEAPDRPEGWRESMMHKVGEDSTAKRMGNFEDYKTKYAPILMKNGWGGRGGRRMPSNS